MAVSSSELVLTDSETLEEVIECLVENFSIQTQGVCDQQTLFEILTYAASNGDSIENTAKLLKNYINFCDRYLEKNFLVYC
ncbi:MAG: hypothetical protein V7L05_28925 [Nostoc sp.]